MDEHKDYIPRAEAQQLVRDLGDTIRREFTAGMSAVQIQIGASEKVLGERIKSAVKWGAVVAALGQVLAAVIALKYGTRAPSEIGSALRALVP